MKAAPFTAIYEDENIIAVSKAAGVSVGGDRWDESQERLDRLVAEAVCPQETDGTSAKLFTVHRIDKETSGLVVFAKNEAAHRRLSLAFEGRDAAKRYIAVVQGRPLWKETACDLPLVPNGNKQHLTIIDRFRGKKSLTRFVLLGSAGNCSVLEALPETGRTHQIRVHAAALGFPVACDSLYGRDKPVLLSSIKKNWRGDPLEEKPLLARLGLHALELSLPASAVSGEPAAGGQRVKLHAPLPRDMAALIRQMEKAASLQFLKPAATQVPKERIIL
ncbi:MAG: RluA family pseudouridine synthase [Treponema sp.]|jgi:RluA family pseudouridine synthase|nr:RluA family pseudouridine synthase [Treponema sp.]